MNATANPSVGVEPSAAGRRHREPGSSGADPLRLGFLLIDNVGLLSYASLAEPFRAANVLRGEPLFSWRALSIGPSQVRASTGVDLVVEGAISDDARYDIIFVCAAGNAVDFHDEATFAWLRAQATTGVRIAGVSGGPFLLARAGLLAGRRCTVHWEHLPAFREEFPNLRIEDRLYVVDGPHMTCAGGGAALDLALQIILESQGEALALAVGDWFIRTRFRAGDGAQRLSVRERYGVTNPVLVRALTQMEAHLAQPLPRLELARRAGASLRHLDRLFADSLGASVSEHYLRLRLSHADALLRETSLSCTEAALASGFTSSSHFTRRYKASFGVSPAARRRAVQARSRGAAAAGPPIA